MECDTRGGTRERPPGTAKRRSAELGRECAQLGQGGPVQIRRRGVGGGHERGPRDGGIASPAGLDEPGEAIKWLEPLSNNFKSPYRQQAEYYLALTYLKNEDYDRSIQTLEHIRNSPGHPFQSRISKRTISDIQMLKWK